MAIRINISDFTDTQKNLIRQHLIHQPEESYIMSRAKKRYGGMMTHNEKEDFQLFETNGNEIWLPMTFACGLLNRDCFEHRKFPVIDLVFNGNLREKQEIVVKEAKEHLEKYNTTTLWLHPGFGKTILGSYLACFLKHKTIVVHTMAVLNNQWYSAFSDFTNAKIWIVGEKKIEDPDVVICMDTRLIKLEDDFISQFGVLIIDEAHEWCSTQNRISKLLRFQPKYIIVESATIEKADKMEKVIRCIAGEHHIRRDYEKEFNALIIKTNYIPEVVKTIHGTNMDALRKELARNERRNNIISDIVKNNPEYKILIVSWLVEHCELLYNKLSEYNNVSSFYGNAKKYNDARVIIGTYKKVGTGFDEALACANWDGKRINLVIMTMLVKDTNFFEQVVGRGLRAEMPNFILLIDDNKTLERHLTENRRWLKNHNCHIRKIHLGETYDDNDVRI